MEEGKLGATHFHAHQEALSKKTLKAKSITSLFNNFLNSGQHSHRTYYKSLSINSLNKATNAIITFTIISLQ